MIIYIHADTVKTYIWIQVMYDISSTPWFVNVVYFEPSSGLQLQRIQSRRGRANPFVGDQRIPLGLIPFPSVPKSQAKCLLN